MSSDSEPKSQVDEVGDEATGGENPTQLVGSIRVAEDLARPYRNMGVLAREVTVIIDPPGVNGNPYSWLRKTFESLMNILITDDIAPQDRIGFTFNSASRAARRPIGLSPRRRDQFSVDVLLQLIETCVQSNEEFFIEGPTRVAFLHIQLPTSGNKGDSKSVSLSTKQDENLPPPTSPTTLSSKKDENKHVLKKMTGTRKRCISCYKDITAEKGTKIARKITKRVATFCSSCDKKPSMCLACFNKNHQVHGAPTSE